MTRQRVFDAKRVVFEDRHREHKKNGVSFSHTIPLIVTQELPAQGQGLPPLPPSRADLYEAR